MKIKESLKKITQLYDIVVFFKGYFQECYDNKITSYYSKEAFRKKLHIFERDDLANKIKQRLSLKGIHPLPKTKGELHIFCAFELNNWESIIPLSLRPFGKVSVFEWKSLGYDVNASNWLKVRDEMNQRMLDSFKEANSIQHVDAVIGYLCGYNTSPKILSKISKSGSIIFNFCWDDKLFFLGPQKGNRYYGPGAIASEVDLNLTNAPGSIIKYMVHEGLAIFWPEAAHPEIHRPYEVPFEYDVSFVGKKYGWRPRFIDSLRKKGVKIVAFGNGWENGSLSDEEMVKLYSKSRINLGFAGVGHSKKLMCLKARDFEIPMSGGLYLTQDNPELSLVYEIGKEIITYKNEKDCVEKINWILSNPQEAEKIRIAGHRRALNEHTWGKRFDYIFKMSGIMNNYEIAVN